MLDSCLEAVKIKPLWDIGKQCRNRSDAAKTAPDQGLHCLLTECSIKI